MAYQVVALTSIEDLPAAVRDFVNANMAGWSAADILPGAGGSVRVQVDMPQGSTADEPARSFVVAALNGIYNAGNQVADNWFYLAYLNDTPVSTKAVSYSPLYPTGPGADDVGIRVTSLVHLFGHQDGDAQSVAGVVEYGAGRYRHFWFGRIRKHGAYAGGDCFSTTQAVNKKQGYVSPVAWYSQRQRYLFSGMGESLYTERRSGNSGGVFVDHAADPVKFREFNCPSSFDPLTSGNGDEVIGGILDGPLDGLFHAAFHPATGKNLLLPIELYALQSPSPNTFYPIGHPAGVRLVNMRNFTPGDEFTVGTDVWKVFPAARLDLVNEMVQYPTSSYLPEEENSGLIGFAYLK